MKNAWWPYLALQVANGRLPFPELLFVFLIGGARLVQHRFKVHHIHAHDQIDNVVGERGQHALVQFLGGLELMRWDLIGGAEE